MSTPEQPATPALTRKQLRDIRNTGSTPVVTPDAHGETASEPAGAADNAPTTPEQQPDVADGAAAEDVSLPATSQAASAPLPRAAVPAPIHDLPGADASVDLGVSPLTRRQARQQERIRTASVPVITPEAAAAHAVDVAQQAEPVDSPVDAVPLSPTIDAEPISPTTETEPPAPVSDAETTTAVGDTQSAAAVIFEVAGADGGPETEQERAVVNPQFGAELLAGEPIDAALPPSFDQLISRSVTGSIGTGNALILSQTPSAPPLVAPVTATGEVIITGSYNLPEGLGSTGHARGTADGKEVDAVLVDGELPAHSSPTPIAASAAISTVKNGGDIIKPPTPEKSGRLMLTLAITAGVLALALVGVLILAFVTGVF